MNDITSMRKEAIENASQACSLDNAGNYEEAIKLYTKAAMKLSQISKIDDNKFNKETYKRKGIEYATRAKELTDLQEGKNPNTNSLSKKIDDPNTKKE